MLFARVIRSCYSLVLFARVNRSCYSLVLFARVIRSCYSLVLFARVICSCYDVNWSSHVLVLAVLAYVTVGRHYSLQQGHSMSIQQIF